MSCASSAVLAFKMHLRRRKLMALDCNTNYAICKERPSKRLCGSSPALGAIAARLIRLLRWAIKVSYPWVETIWCSR